MKDFISRTHWSGADIMAALFSGLAFALVLGHALWAYASHDARVPISEWHKVEIINSPVKAGDAVQAQIYRNKVRSDCTVASSRQAISSDGNVYDLPSAAGMGGDAERNFVYFQYPTRKDMPPGDYTLRVFLTYTCPEFVWATQQPDARFKVKE